jgi:hypothetical protein
VPGADASNEPPAPALQFGTVLHPTDSKGRSTGCTTTGDLVVHPIAVRWPPPIDTLDLLEPPASLVEK